MKLNETECLRLVHTHHRASIDRAFTVSIIKLSLGFLQKYSQESPKQSTFSPEFTRTSGPPCEGKGCEAVRIQASDSGTKIPAWIGDCKAPVPPSPLPEGVETSRQAPRWGAGRSSFGLPQEPLARSHERPDCLSQATLSTERKLSKPDGPSPQRGIQPLRETRVSSWRLPHQQKREHLSTSQIPLQAYALPSSQKRLRGSLHVHSTQTPSGTQSQNANKAEEPNKGREDYVRNPIAQKCCHRELHFALRFPADKKRRKGVAVVTKLVDKKRELSSRNPA